MKLRKIIWLSIISVAAVFMAVAIFVVYPKFFLEKKKPVNFVVFPDNGLEIKVELAATPYDWAKGLMFRDKLAQNTGMLFVFPDEAIRTFWMKNTLIPLDIIYISKDNKIVDIKENFVPCPDSVLNCPTYQSKLPAMYVLELEAGVVRGNNISTGDSVEIKNN